MATKRTNTSTPIKTVITKDAPVTDLINRYIVLHSKRDPLFNTIGGLFYRFFDCGGDGAWNYKYAMMQFLQAVSNPEIAKVLGEKMCFGHYNDFIDMLGRLSRLLDDTETAPVIQALMDLHEVSGVNNDLEVDDEANLAKKYWAKVLEEQALATKA